MRSKKLWALSALVAAAVVAGCAQKSSDGDTIYNWLRGTPSLDTLDLNIETDAYPVASFVGSNGEVVLSFEQAHLYNNNPNWYSWYNFYRGLGVGAGAIQEVDYFAQEWDYDQNFDNGAVSYNKRYTVGLNWNNNDQLYLSAYDSARGMYGKSVAILDFDSSQTGYFNNLYGVYVDNSGLATILFQAESSLFINSTVGWDDEDALWAIQVDVNTNTITQQATKINRAFENPGHGSNEADAWDWAIAVNGDICIMVDMLDDYDPTAGFDWRWTLENIFFDRSAGTWNTVRLDPINDGSGDPNQSYGWAILDTDGHSFQVAFEDDISTSNGFTAIYTSRFIAGSSATNFPAVTDVDTSAGTGVSFVNELIALVFGRDGTSLVSWTEYEEVGTGENVYGDWFSWSDTTNGPSTTRTHRALDFSIVNDDGYDVGSGIHERGVFFQDNGNAAIVFTVWNNDTSWSDEELYIGTLNKGTNTYTAPNSGSANLASEDSASGTNLYRELTGFGGSGYSAGTNNPTLVVGWNAIRYDQGGTSATRHRLSVVLVTDLTVGTPVGLEHNTDYPLEDILLASTNNIKNSGVYGEGSPTTRQLCWMIDPDTLPAVGNGVVWIVFLQVTPVGSSTSGSVRAHAWNYNRNTQTALNSMKRDVLGWHGNVDHLETLHATTGGSATLFLNYLGQSVRVNMNPSASGTVAGTSDNGVDVTPVDMAGGEAWAHLDGQSFRYTHNSVANTISTTFQGGSRIWSIWSGHDIISDRVFGKRTR